MLSPMAVVGISLSALAFLGFSAFLARRLVLRRRTKIGVHGIPVVSLTQRMSGINTRTGETELSALAGLAEENCSGSAGNQPPSPDLDENGAELRSSKRVSCTKRAERYRRIPARKITHHKHAPLADADGDHSILAHVTLAWRAAIRDPSDSCGGSADDDSGDGYGSGVEMELRVEQMLDAFVSTLAICEVFGPLMSLAIKNDQANFDKVRNAWNELSARGEPQRCSRLRGLLETERATGIHKAGGVLADPSAAIALVWIRRSLDFQNSILDGLANDRFAALANVARDAYKTHLEGFHNFWLKNTFRAALAGLPSRAEFLQRLAPNHSGKPDERDAVCYAEMTELVEVQHTVVVTILALFVELGLEDDRKA